MRAPATPRPARCSSRCLPSGAHALPVTSVAPHRSKAYAKWPRAFTTDIEAALRQQPFLESEGQWLLRSLIRTRLEAFVATFVNSEQQGAGLAGRSRGIWRPTPIVICSCQRL